MILLDQKMWKDYVFWGKFDNLLVLFGVKTEEKKSAKRNWKCQMLTVPVNEQMRMEVVLELEKNSLWVWTTHIH